MMADKTFSIIDYVVFAMMLAISAIIGFYYAWKDKRDKKQNANEFLLGGRNLTIFPVAMSIMASFVSAISILGNAQEVYRFGTIYFLLGLNFFLSHPFVAYFYLPVFHRLNITSAYEYLELRFNRTVKFVSSTIFCIQAFCFMAIVLYAPSLAIEKVTGFPLWISILSTGVVCTLYTSLGGMKAVIWTDTFQVLVMFVGLSTVIIKGVIQIGGFNIMWKRAEEAERIEFFNFDPSPFQRHTFWTLIFGGFFTSLTVYGANQATIQRYLTIPTVKQAQKAVHINTITTFIFFEMMCLSGLVAFGLYYRCDLLLSKKILKGEQILPYAVMDLLYELPGLPGLFISCIFSASLSTISSGLNSLAAVCLRDFVMPIYKHKNKPMSDKTATNISKLLGLLFGAGTIGLAYICQYLGDPITQATISLFGMLGGPLLGVISLGLFVPQANSKGAICGLVSSVVTNLFLGIGTILTRTSTANLKPQYIDGCLNSSTIITQITTNTTRSIMQAVQSSELRYYLFRLSYLHYSGFSVFVCFSVALVTSAITGFNDPATMDSRLFHDYKKLFKSKKKVEKTNGKRNEAFMMESVNKKDIAEVFL